MPDHIVTNPVFTKSAMQQIMAAYPDLLTTTISVLRGAKSKWDINNNTQANLSTTALGFLRGAGQEDNPYKAGTLRERAYMRSLHPERLASQANMELLDNEEMMDEELDMAIRAGEFDNPLPNDDFSTSYNE
jgi:hypothetical protein